MPIGRSRWPARPESFTAHERGTGGHRFVLPGPELSDDEWQGLLETTVEMAEKADLVVASGSLALGVPDDFYARLAQALDQIGFAWRSTARARAGRDAGAGARIWSSRT